MGVRLNPDGLQLKSDGRHETVARFRPWSKWRWANLGQVYGGLLASLIDCHGTGSASAAAGRARPDEAPFRFVTASLHVDYLRPTIIEAELRRSCGPSRN